MAGPLFNVATQGFPEAEKHANAIPVYFAHGYHSCPGERSEDRHDGTAANATLKRGVGIGLCPLLLFLYQFPFILTMGGPRSGILSPQSLPRSLARSLTR